MMKVKATALKQPFSTLIQNILQNNTQDQFNKSNISKAVGDRSDNNVVHVYLF